MPAVFLLSDISGKNPSKKGQRFLVLPGNGDNFTDPQDLSEVTVPEYVFSV